MGLTQEEMVNVWALAYLGRGEYEKSEWDDAVAEGERLVNEHTIDVLLGMPLLSNYLEEGLSQFDLSCTEFEIGRL
jgi:hypothetical protein